MTVFALILLILLTVIVFAVWFFVRLSEAFNAFVAVGLFFVVVFFGVAGILKVTTGDSGLDKVSESFFGKNQPAVVQAPRQQMEVPRAPVPMYSTPAPIQHPQQAQALKEVSNSMDSVGAFFLAFAFLFSGAWVWLWFGVYFLLGGCFWYNDKIPNGLALTAGATVLWFVLWPHAWGSFREHMFQLFVYAIPLYLGLGVAWSALKYRLILNVIREQIIDGFEAYKRSRERAAVEAQKAKNDQDRMVINRGLDEPHRFITSYPASPFLTNDQIDKRDFIPSITKKGYARSKIINWMLFWPWSVVNYVFGKLLHDLLNLIVDSFGKVYNALAHSVMKDLKNLTA